MSCSLSGSSVLTQLFMLYALIKNIQLGAAPPFCSVLLDYEFYVVNPKQLPSSFFFALVNIERLSLPKVKIGQYLPESLSPLVFDERRVIGD